MDGNFWMTVPNSPHRVRVHGGNISGRRDAHVAPCWSPTVELAKFPSRKSFHNAVVATISSYSRLATICRECPGWFTIQLVIRKFHIILPSLLRACRRMRRDPPRSCNGLGHRQERVLPADVRLVQGNMGIVLREESMCASIE